MALPSYYQTIIKQVQHGNENIIHTPPVPPDDYHESLIRAIAAAYGYKEEEPNKFERSDLAWVFIGWDDVLKFSFPMPWVRKVVFVERNQKTHTDYASTALRNGFKQISKLDWPQLGNQKCSVYEFERL